MIKFMYDNKNINIAVASPCFDLFTRVDSYEYIFLSAHCLLYFVSVIIILSCFFGVIILR